MLDLIEMILKEKRTQITADDIDAVIKASKTKEPASIWAWRVRDCPIFWPGRIGSAVTKSKDTSVSSIRTSSPG